jgi:hypothetical protein
MAILFRRSLIVPVWVFVFGMVFMSSPDAGFAPTLLTVVEWGVVALGVLVLLCAAIPRVFHTR